MIEGPAGLLKCFIWSVSSGWWGEQEKPADEGHGPAPLTGNFVLGGGAEGVG